MTARRAALSMALSIPIAGACRSRAIQSVAQGLQAASAITSTLTTATPVSLIHAATSACPNIAAQGSAANTTPFVVSVLPSAAAGAPLDFTWLTASVQPSAYQ